VAACQMTDDSFPSITPHDLRHTAASLAISAGANVKAMQRMLGHAEALMTLDTYAASDRPSSTVGSLQAGAVFAYPDMCHGVARSSTGPDTVTPCTTSPNRSLTVEVWSTCGRRNR
jgi:Phage integrase family